MILSQYYGSPNCRLSNCHHLRWYFYSTPFISSLVWNINSNTAVGWQITSRQDGGWQNVRECENLPVTIYNSQHNNVPREITVWPDRSKIISLTARPPWAQTQLIAHPPILDTNTTDSSPTHLGHKHNWLPLQSLCSHRPTYWGYFDFLFLSSDEMFYSYYTKQFCTIFIHFKIKKEFVLISEENKL